MSGLAFWTWAAIAVLIAGPLLVFVWFVRDLVRLGWRGRGPGAEEKPDGGPG